MKTALLSSLNIISLSKEVTRKQTNTILFLGAMQVSQSMQRTALYSAAWEK